jgi:hypothetical protein
VTPDNTNARVTRFPADAPPEPQTALSNLARLCNWRDGSAAMAITTAALLPFAITWHVTYTVAIATSLTAATLIALSTHLAHQDLLRTLAIHPQFAHHPELAQKHRRLASDRNRRKLANGLRRTAAPTQPPARFDGCPILHDRVAVVRLELLEIATALEKAHDPDPTCVALIHELLTNACSPLYNDNIPAADLHATLNHARAGLRAQPRG